MCCNSMSLLSFPTLHCKSIAKPSMESVTCAGLCLYEPGAALLSCVPCGQVSGIWCPAGQSRGTRFWHMEPSSQDEAGLGALVQRSLSVAISLDLRWLWEPGALVSLMPASWLAVANSLSTPPAELLVPLFPSISALTGTSLGLGTAGGADHSWLLVESRQLPGHKQLPCCLHKLVSICHVWWHPRAFQNYPGAVDAALSGKGALLAWSI